MVEATFKQIGETYYFDIQSVPLGSGTFGVVFKGYSNKDDDEEVAIKVISKAILEQYKDHLDTLMREIEILRKIKGKHIIELKEILRTPNNLYIITTFCNGGNLETKLALNGGKLTERETLKILKQIAEAFVEIENIDLKNANGAKLSIMHRDIKPANILFHNGDVCLCDFGFAKIVDENTSDRNEVHTMLGTTKYMPPQILREEPYTSKCDIWSTGIAVYEMLHGEAPYKAPSRYGMEKLIKEKELQFDKGLYIETVELVSQMLQDDESKRPTWKEILAHPALTKKRSRVRIIEEVIGTSKNEVKDNK
mmetsp:Transcript_61460/g.71527  ORF Transcript_61460/g.71527 Transcript_61460/m.71527 type:complete len:309 (-) Transcript_61460:101-1027(-)